MAELTPQERLQPALLDRLTDEAPDKKSEPREARVITKARLRQAVLRDLSWLFNASRLSGDVDWSTHRYAEHSVVNFGLPPLSGQTATALDVGELEKAIRQAILDFEPRIIPSTLEVSTPESQAGVNHHNIIYVQIRGQLWAQPVPLELLLRTEVDLETGEVEIRELT